MSSTDNCKTCGKKAGLSVLLVRPSAIATDSAFAPAEADKLKTHEPSVQALKLPALESSRYVLRLLRRDGFVYAYYPKPPPQLIKPWQAFRVQGSGVLIPESEIAWTNPKSEFACTKSEAHPHDLRTLCIELPKNNPESAGVVWIGFSMNWWDDEMRAKIQKDPASAGMVCINPLQELGGVKQAFKAQADDIQKYVADFGLRSMNHGGSKSGTNLTEGGTEPATPFYNGPEDRTYGQARGLQTVMKRQADHHPATQGKEIVLTLQDNAGLAGDLNGIRLAKVAANQKKWNDNEDWVRSQACHTTLEGIRKSIQVASVQRAWDRGTRVSEKHWQDSLTKQWGPKYSPTRYTWSPDPAGGYADDGSRAGRLEPIPDYADEFKRRMQQNASAIGKRHWARITDQLDMGKYKAWPAKREQIEKQLADELAPYEADWLKCVDRLALRHDFARQYDENDPGKLTARVSSGGIYAAESHLVHCPQPCTARHTERWVGLVLEPEITHPDAVALRAYFGNQREVIVKVHAMLIGKIDRSPTPGTNGQGDLDNLRDKTYDILKTVITLDGLAPKLNWLHPRVMALSLGMQAATMAGVVQLLAVASGKGAAPPSGKLAEYERKLTPLLAAQRQLDLAVGAAQAGGAKAAPSIAIVLKTQVSVHNALALLYGSDVSKRQVNKATKQLGSPTVELLTLTDVDTARAVHEGRIRPNQISGTPLNLERKNTKGIALRSPQELAQDMARLPVNQPLAPDEVAEVFRRQANVKEINLRTVDGRLAAGAMMVQFLGLYQNVHVLLDELGKSQRDADKLTDAITGTIDSAGGFLGAALDRWAAAYKATLVMRAGKEAAELSTKLALLKAGTALTGMLGGAIMFFSMQKKADKAEAEGDTDSADGYISGSRVGGLQVLYGAFVGADTLAKGAATRAIARHVFVRLAGSVATEAVVGAAAITVGAIVTITGLALLAAGTAAVVYAVVTERDSYQRWAGRCYFGKDTGKRFGSAAEEAQALAAIDYEGQSQQEVARLAKRYPDPGRPAAPPSVDISNLGALP